MKFKKENIDEFKKNNVSSYGYIRRVRLLGIIGVIYSIGISVFDYINRNDKGIISNYRLSLILDISVLVVSILFIIMSQVLFNKLVKKYNLKKYKSNKNKNNK